MFPWHFLCMWFCWDYLVVSMLSYREFSVSLSQGPSFCHSNNNSCHRCCAQCFISFNPNSNCNTGGISPPYRWGNSLWCGLRLVPDTCILASYSRVSHSGSPVSGKGRCPATCCWGCPWLRPPRFGGLITTTGFRMQLVSGYMNMIFRLQ